MTMKTINDINLYTWFTTREVSYNFAHFTPTTVAITPESKAWILEKLTGRFYISYSAIENGPNTVNKYPGFEDPKEALLYELTWG